MPDHYNKHEYNVPEPDYPELKDYKSEIGEIEYTIGYQKYEPYAKNENYYPNNPDYSAHHFPHGYADEFSDFGFDSYHGSDGSDHGHGFGEDVKPHSHHGKSKGPRHAQPFKLPSVDEYFVPVIRDNGPYANVDIEIPRYNRGNHYNEHSYDHQNKNAYDVDFLHDLGYEESDDHYDYDHHDYDDYSYDNHDDDYEVYDEYDHHDYDDHYDSYESYDDNHYDSYDDHDDHYDSYDDQYESYDDHHYDVYDDHYDSYDDHHNDDYNSYDDYHYNSYDDNHDDYNHYSDYLDYDNYFADWKY